jgi:hypothetical protein
MTTALDLIAAKLIEDGCCADEETAMVAANSAWSAILAAPDSVRQAPAALLNQGRPIEESAEIFHRAWRKHMDLAPPWSTVSDKHRDGVIAGIYAVTGQPLPASPPEDKT